MISDWPQATKNLSAMLRDLRGGAGSAEAMKSFSALASSATKAGALDARTKELIALAIGVAVRCDDCIAFHAKAAAQLGATRAEVEETLSMAIYMGAGPSVMYSSHALQAFNQFSETKAE
ncbi:carboxymuconolactone decarboxylase [Rhodoblastus sphagnicola]|uniref:Carboxymuconolactone decarboxylase n=1 Tax=Rhodoblastus sphagnicola TaxID=333368 RepID=A0A2S6N4Q1_9HYPH|nr:carboxymuconolactone decarboxylase family protein [Rhodoblastus sphagnicola]MBB4199595.1 AhpD family alkylhydroperoxidase [Rhodoblastus sphagnicola]PPQ29601.1 carboxymuconolactone decarboxylase [Rhodoblastus sphagnicola]